MSVFCHIDGNEYDSVAEIHALLKSLRVKQSSYYEKHFPRVCKGSGQSISYKDYKQYFSQEFVDKDALKKWIHTNPAEGKAWAIEWLRKRKEDKGLVYAPTQVELESLSCPSMRYYDWIGDYYLICRELGFSDRYQIAAKSTAKAVNVAQTGIICDTREQLPLKLTVKTVRSTLNWGDYALAAPYSPEIRIERKSLTDMIGTLSGKQIKHKRIATDSPSERFERELMRAQKENGYLVMMVESPIEDALSFRDLPSIKHGKASSSHIFKNMRDLLVKYPLTWQVVFVKNHADAATKLIKIFEMGDQVRKIDLQYAIERGVL